VSNALGVLEMIVQRASIDCDKITDWESFHSEFDRVFGFPDFYGRNMDAWIDCMTSIDEPPDGLTSIHCEKGSFLTIECKNMGSLKERCPEQYLAIIECSAFINFRRIEVDDPPVLALSFHA
jgi:RNAse (barnase) inhibitor barstar